MSDTPHLFLALCCRAVHPPPVPACRLLAFRYSLPHHLLHSPFAQVRGTPARHFLDAGQDLSVPGSLLHGLFFRLPMGHWTRANAEICLLAVRGHPKRQAKDVHQVIISHVEEHSKKPDEVRERIERDLWGMGCALSYLPVRKLMAGMFGVMKSSMMWN